MTEDTQFIDAEQFQGSQQDKLTFRMLVMEHLRRILKLSSVEFVGGYWQSRMKVVGGGTFSEEYYVPDTREEYSNAVDVLYDMLYPHFDKEMLEAGEKAEQDTKQAYKDALYDDNRDKEQKFNKQQYRHDKREIKRKLFRDISCFLKRNKYMEGAVFEEEV